MVCSSCGTDNPAGAKFCNGCGQNLSRACPACGTANAGGARFCNECGATLDAPAQTVAVAATAAAPAAERRLVSVLFADLVGFTALSESRDAEEVRDLLSRYFDSCRRLIELYGGTVEKFIGDAVMAVWGTPTATEDDAERAVRAALDLVAAVSALGDEVGATDLRARAGVLTGEAAVTIGAEGQGMVAGDLVNTASRIQSVAEPGSVLVGEATRRTTEQTIAYDDAGSFELKGKDGLVPLWRALRVVSGARGSLRSEGLEAPFVGRDRELRQMKELFHACAEDGKPHVASITGVAGIGKSRLGWEFYKYIDGLVDTTYWHRGRCLAYGEGVTYWALADMVRMRCRIGEEEVPAAAQEKLGAALDEYMLDAEERRFVEPALAQLLGLGGQEGRDRDALFAAWRLFFERLAETLPVTLLFEDMQWADASLLDFVEYLVEWSRTSPIFVITLSRPELAEKRPNWGAAVRNFTSLYLEPLPERAMESLLDGLVPGLPAVVRTQILARAEGVPLYAVETVRMLLDRNLLVREGSVYRPVGEIESLEVPETLHALIAARLDGLGTEERRLLQDAAVLGKTFAREALAAVTTVPAEDLDRLLGSLVRKEILGVQADPRSPEHGQYGFLQDLLRHVAYETLSKRDRRERHLAAAEHLAASVAEDEVAEVVASHLLDAYALEPDPALKERARVALVRAGDRAAALAAAAEAQRYFERAAELAEDPVEKTQLIARAGTMAWRANQPSDARRLLEQSIATALELGRPRLAAKPAGELAEIDIGDGNLQAGVERLESILAALGGDSADADADVDIATVAVALGRLQLLAGRLDEAERRLDLALRLSESLDEVPTLADALNSRGVLLIFQGRLHEGGALLSAAVELALTNNLHAPALRALHNLCEVYYGFDRITESILISDRGIQLARRLGDRQWEVGILTNALAAYFFVGRWDEAVAMTAEGEQLAVSVFVRGGLLYHVFLLCERGEVDAARELLERNADVGEVEEAQSVAGHAVATARLERAEGRYHEAMAAAQVAYERESGDVSFTKKLAMIEIAEAAFALGDEDRVRRLLAEMEAMPPGQRRPLRTAQSLRFRARLDADDQAFEAAAVELRKLELPFYLAATLTEHAESLASRGRAGEGEALLDEARGIFEHLRAQPWLERVDALRTPLRALA